MSPFVRTILGLAFFARLPRPWRRRRPVVVPPAPPVELARVGYGRRCAELDPARPVVGTFVRTYQDAHPGTVFRGMQAIPSGQHRPRTLVDVVGDDDTPTVRFRMDRTDTELLPRVLLTALAPVPAGAGVR